MTFSCIFCCANVCAISCRVICNKSLYGQTCKYFFIVLFKLSMFFNYKALHTYQCSPNMKLNYIFCTDIFLYQYIFWTKYSKVLKPIFVGGVGRGSKKTIYIFGCLRYLEQCLAIYLSMRYKLYQPKDEFLCFKENCLDNIYVYEKLQTMKALLLAQQFILQGSSLHIGNRLYHYKSNGD